MTCVLLVIGTIITLFIVHKDVNNSFSYRFVSGYIIFLMVCFLYFTFITILNMRTLRWIEIRGSLVKFIVLFTILCVLKYVSTYGLKPENVDFWGDLFTPLGLSLGLSFYDLVLTNKSNI